MFYKLVSIYKQASNKTSGCQAPPTADKVSSSLSFSFVEGELWSGSELTYRCDQYYRFITDTSNVLTCQDDGSWLPKYPPPCAPGYFIIYNNC